ncbi:CYTH domain-containing protein [Maribacter chungangensis]|uniref:CYTH domain-containing protein n=1 Tax=Maribacter chungangensis TaxID=1069117 RepID=A0ABW3B819_9FLAO
MLEVERKFLVTSQAYKNETKTRTRIVQGFLNTDPERTVRVRIKGEKGFLTVKGKGNDTGTTRFEWEKEISFSDATDLIDLCEAVILEKIRYEIPVGKHVFEVDEFLGENKGLTVAEIELQHEDEPFEKPNWLGEEVTGDNRYYNSQLSQHPYRDWES